MLERLDRLGSPATMASNGGRYFGFVTGGTDPAAQAAAILAGAWDQNAALPVMSPVAAHLDGLAAAWACDLLGMPPGAVATFCGGATVANLTGILAGRDALLARLGWDVDRQGLAGAPPLRVVTGAEAHSSVHKALRMAGIGRDAVTFVPTDDCGRVDAAAFGAGDVVVDERTLVILQAGNVNTGHSDPFAEVVGPAHAAGAWAHVDGAFGLWAAAAPARRHLVAGVETADSWATDAHKWLNLPYDSGIAVCARVEDLHRAFATEAAYLTVGAVTERAPMHLSVQMSQRARGVEAWATLASRGRAGIAALVEDCCLHATHLADLLVAGGLDLLAPVVLNQALVAAGDDAATGAADRRDPARRHLLGRCHHVARPPRPPPLGVRRGHDPHRHRGGRGRHPPAQPLSVGSPARSRACSSGSSRAVGGDHGEDDEGGQDQAGDQHRFGAEGGQQHQGGGARAAGGAQPPGRLGPHVESPHHQDVDRHRHGHGGPGLHVAQLGVARRVVDPDGQAGAGGGRRGVHEVVPVAPHEGHEAPRPGGGAGLRDHPLAGQVEVHPPQAEHDEQAADDHGGQVAERALGVERLLHAERRRQHRLAQDDDREQGVALHDVAGMPGRRGRALGPPGHRQLGHRQHDEPGEEHRLGREQQRHPPQLHDRDAQREAQRAGPALLVRPRRPQPLGDQGQADDHVAAHHHPEVACRRRPGAPRRPGSAPP